MNKDQQKAILKHAELHKQMMYTVEYFENWVSRNAGMVADNDYGGIMLEHDIPKQSRIRIYQALMPVIQKEIETLRQEAEAMPLLPKELQNG